MQRRIDLYGITLYQLLAGLDQCGTVGLADLNKDINTNHDFMFLIVGLGNPEKDYSRTRHNMGFDVINKIADEFDIEISRSRFKGIYGSGMIGGNKVILLKPQTFMNLSGESIIEFKNFYKIENNKIIIISDDIDLEPGKIRIRKKGGPGTHNGMKSVIHYLNSDDFIRVRVGIGVPKDDESLVEYVIGYIPDEEYEVLQDGIDIAKNAVVDIIKNNVDYAMNKYNGAK